MLSLCKRVSRFVLFRSSSSSSSSSSTLCKVHRFETKKSSTFSSSSKTAAGSIRNMAAAMPSSLDLGSSIADAPSALDAALSELHLSSSTSSSSTTPSSSSFQLQKHPPRLSKEADIVSIAPMMEWTDRHYRFLMRLLTRRTRLYTEMVVSATLLHSPVSSGYLRFHPLEHPVACQIGGSDPESLAAAAKLVEAAGYDEVNLNCGCPSARVAGKGCFGAALMFRPELVRDCVAAMKAAVKIPVTVKCRLGADAMDSYEEFKNFVEVVSTGGCTHFILHARKCLLKGLDPKQNRTVPPLKYHWAQRIALEMPHLRFSVNGGIVTWQQSEQLLSLKRGIVGQAPVNVTETADAAYAAEAAEKVERNAAKIERTIAAEEREKLQIDKQQQEQQRLGDDTTATTTPSSTYATNKASISVNAIIGAGTGAEREEVIQTDGEDSCGGGGSSAVDCARTEQEEANAIHSSAAASASSLAVAEAAVAKEQEEEQEEARKRASDANNTHNMKGDSSSSSSSSSYVPLSATELFAAYQERGRIAKKLASTSQWLPQTQFAEGTVGGSHFIVPGTYGSEDSVLDSVMIGRAAYNNSWMFADVDRRFFGVPNPGFSRRQILLQYMEYAETVISTLPEDEQEMKMYRPFPLVKPLVGLFAGEFGVNRFRFTLFNMVQIENKSVREAVTAAMKHLPDEVLDEVPPT